MVTGVKLTLSSCLGLTGGFGENVLERKSASRFVTPGMCTRKVSLYNWSAWSNAISRAKQFS